MARIVMIVMVMAAFVLAACGAPAAPVQQAGASNNAAARQPAAQQPAAAPAAQQPAAAPATSSGAATGIEASGGSANAPANAPAETNQLQYGLRMVILTANLVIEVDSVDQAEAKLRDAVDRVGGYILRVRTTGEGNQKTSYISFRVPFEHFERVLADVEGVAQRVISRTVDGEDVTEQYVDLESRLRNLEATYARLTALLERSGTLEETLRLNQEISSVQGQIEQVKGRMRYLEQNVNYSTITVELRPILPTPTPTPEPPKEKEGWNPSKVLSEQVALLMTFIQNIINILIVLGVWAPVWIIPVLLIIWFVRVQSKTLYGERKYDKKAETTSSDAEAKP
ncbi:DUF4349 domain-containing protein, partial [Chloroflexus sp.]|uniref:DUF4349 domain-containing protein n=1 Tax=Chloroflexus sp. TaxID=1904827 RepID=UPI002ACDE9E7